MVDTVTVQSLPRYLHEVFKHFDAGYFPLFRGLKDASYQLIPSAGRLWLRAHKNRGTQFKEFESMLAFKMQQFMDRAIPHLENSPTHILEEWALAQHHGLPTCFMDWSLNPLVGLFFAVDERSDRRPQDKRTDSAVYAFPGNVESMRPHAPKNKDVDWNAVDRIFAYAPRHVSRRITAQQGVFTFHPEPWQEYSPEGLTKFIIPMQHRMSILQQLDVCGINEHFIYQDFDGLGAILNYQLGALDS